jgi:hypothetical protein
MGSTLSSVASSLNARMADRTLRAVPAAAGTEASVRRGRTITG